MNKLVLKDFVADWKEGFRRAFGGFQWFPYLYVVFLCPLVMEPLNTIYGWYVLEMGALVLCMVVMRMFPLHIRRTLFLCPMDREQRIEYLKCGCRLRIGIGMGICTAANVAALAGGRIPIGVVSVLFGVQIIFVQVTGLFMEEPYRKGRYETWSRTGLWGYSFCLAVSVTSAVLNMLIWLVWGAAGEIEDFGIFGRILVALGLLLQISMSALLLGRYRKRLLAAAADYENTYVVWEQQK